MGLMTLGLHGLESDLKKSWGSLQALANMGFSSLPMRFMSRYFLKRNVITFSLSCADLEAIDELKP